MCQVVTAPFGSDAISPSFCAAKAAEGASPRTVEWYRMILVRAVRRFGEARPVDAIPAAELRAWLLELRAKWTPTDCVCRRRSGPRCWTVYTWTER